jgi:hypothetical protein
MIRLSAFLPKLALSAAAALAAISLSPGSAQAFGVNVGGQDWDVSTFTGTYDAKTSKFALPANGGVMPWFGRLRRQLCEYRLAQPSKVGASCRKA